MRKRSPRYGPWRGQPPPDLPFPQSVRHVKGPVATAPSSQGHYKKGLSYTLAIGLWPRTLFLIVIVQL